MPNYCENDLQIYADDPADVKRVIDFIAGDDDGEKTVIDFNKLIQYPKKYQALDDVAQQFEKEVSGLAKDDQEGRRLLREKYGLSENEWRPTDGYNQGGYEWCNQNWGTKWNAIEPLMDDRSDNDDTAVFHFDTAWSPPHPVIKVLAKKFPKVTIHHEWYERGMEYCGSARYENGEKTDFTQGKYYGIRGG